MPRYLRIDFLPLIGEYRYAERSIGAFRIGEMEDCMRIGEFALIFSEEFMTRLSKALNQRLLCDELDDDGRCAIYGEDGKVYEVEIVE